MSPLHVLLASDNGLCVFNLHDQTYTRYFIDRKVLCLSRIDRDRFLIGMIGEEDGNELVVWDRKSTDGWWVLAKVDRFNYIQSIQKVYLEDRLGEGEPEAELFIVRYSEGVKAV